MTKLLFTVVEAFETDKSRLEVLSNITTLPIGYQSGDPVCLRRPDGQELEAYSGWIHTFTDPKVVLSDQYEEQRLLFWLEGLKKDDVPPGTQVLMLKEHPPGKLRRRWERVKNKES